MPLSNPVSRVARHRRAITVEAYLREDGWWDIEARLTDTKPRDIPLASGGMRLRGQPLHDLWLRVTIDTHMNVVDAEACSDWVPYPTYCDTIGPAYRKLIGLNLMKGFRKAARERLGGVAGCTHLTELCGVLPTAAIQAFAGDVFPVRDNSNDHRPIEPGRRHRTNSMAATPCISRARWSVSTIRAGLPTSRLPRSNRQSPSRHRGRRRDDGSPGARVLTFITLIQPSKGNTHEYP